MRIVIKDTPKEVAEYTAAFIVKRINDFAPTRDKPFVLGLPTGSTPLLTYQRLIQFFREGAVSFKHVVTFNMDEYCGLPRHHEQSYWHFMHKNFFSMIDIPPENINLPDATAPDLISECARYEEKIRALGGIELQLGGVGSDGHLAFNEPGSSLTSGVRVKSLNHETIADNARFFDNDIKKVPTMAITIGIKTIMDARNVVILATGSNKSQAVERAVEGYVTHVYPVSVLQMHKSCVLVVDEKATMDLKVKTVVYYKKLAERENELAVRQANAKAKSGQRQSKL
jgi:glucosamine-6-phosphate deaminase